MDNKCIRVIINGLRFLGTSFYNRVLAVDTTTIIRKASKAKIVIGKEFRSRRNVEINARGKSLICIGNHVFINSTCIITARERIEIGDNTIFGPGVIVYDNDHVIRNGHVIDDEFQTAPVIIGKNVWIGANAVILKGSIIGDGCVVAAGSVVKGIVPKGNVFIQKRVPTMKLIRGREDDN